MHGRAGPAPRLVQLFDHGGCAKFAVAKLLRIDRPLTNLAAVTANCDAK
jgi:hypothetical protein